MGEMMLPLKAVRVYAAAIKSGCGRIVKGGETPAGEVPSRASTPWDTCKTMGCKRPWGCVDRRKRRTPCPSLWDPQRCRQIRSKAFRRHGGGEEVTGIEDVVLHIFKSRPWNWLVPLLVITCITDMPFPYSAPALLDNDVQFADSLRRHLNAIVTSRQHHSATVHNPATHSGLRSVDPDISAVAEIAGASSARINPGDQERITPHIIADQGQLRKLQGLR